VPLRALTRIIITRITATTISHHFSLPGTMHLLNLSIYFSVVSAAAVAKPEKVSYDGYKVVRVAVGDQLAKINDVVSSLGLATWKGAPRAGAFADIVVPPTKLGAFTEKVAGLDVLTMHEDLGASIAEESTFHTYAGTCLYLVR
jgi:hypothetical protein